MEISEPSTINILSIVNGGIIRLKTSSITIFSLFEVNKPLISILEYVTELDLFCENLNQKGLTNKA